MNKLFSWKNLAGKTLNKGHVVLLLLLALNTYADPNASSPTIAPSSTNSATTSDDLTDNNVYKTRQEDEKKASNNPFSILLYHPTYILPYYYTQMPDSAAYSNLPNNQSIQSQEVKAQLSFKVPVWQDILSSKANLYVAYTQLSYWQVYQASPFFRETDYEPELFANYPVTQWLVLQTGVDHQSNGVGGSQERSWNRYYGEGIASLGNWMIDAKPWVPIFTANSMDIYNPNMPDYLGYGQITTAYKLHDVVFAIMVRNEAESNFARGAEEFTISVPLGVHFKFYVDAFSGYGQSLIEYNHYTNAIGAGIALNDVI